METKPWKRVRFSLTKLICLTLKFSYFISSYEHLECSGKYTIKYSSHPYSLDPDLKEINIVSSVLQIKTLLGNRMQQIQLKSISIPSPGQKPLSNGSVFYPFELYFYYPIFIKKICISFGLLYLLSIGKAISDSTLLLRFMKYIYSLFIELLCDILFYEFVSQSCQNQWPQTGWLKTREICPLRVSEAWGLRWRCLRGHPPPEDFEGESSLALS